MSYLAKHLITSECLLKKSNIPVIKEVDFVNGLIIDLYSFASSHDLANYDYLFEWLPKMLDRPKGSINLKAVVSKVQADINKQVERHSRLPLSR